MMGNPVMFVVEIGSVITTVLLVRGGAAAFLFNLQITLWLWFTVLFANFAEAMAEGRGKAQADTLRKARSETVANRIELENGQIERVPSSNLRAGDMVPGRSGRVCSIGDGEIVEGVASVDESAITGESAPVIREAGGDRSAVTGGTRVLSDEIRVKVTSNPGETFLDRMIALVEGAERQKTPNEIALNILLAGFDDHLSVGRGDVAAIRDLLRRAAVSICAGFAAGLPDPHHHRRPAFGDRHRRHGPADSTQRAGDVGPRGGSCGRRRHAAARQNRNHHAGQSSGVRVYPGAGRERTEMADAAQLSSLADETPEGRSIVVLAKEKYGLRGRELSSHDMEFVPFTAQTRMSGVNMNGNQIRKGAVDAITSYLAANGSTYARRTAAAVETIASSGGTPLVVAEKGCALGVIHLKDIVKGGMRDRFDQLRAIGIKTVMITGDNPLTAAAIAREAGVDDFLAEATPKDKMDLIRREQAQGKLVAMTGDGTNDAPALAQADVGVAMNTGTQAAKEAGNMVDLDSNPTKLIEVVAIGKQLLMTRGSLTTFSIANDVAKYFAIIPAMFAGTFPVLNTLNIMHLRTPQSAILSAVIFNAVIIIALIPLALRGVKYRPLSAAALLRRNLWIYGVAESSCRSSGSS